MREIIKIGLEDMNLSSIYWYVDKKNQRAIKFYDKNGYQRIFPEIIGVETKPIFGIKKQNNDMYAYTLALGYISVKMRSIKEINDYLIKKGFNNLVANKVSERLIKEGYLNDLKYAKSFINDSMNLTNKGPQKIKMELIKYAVNKDIIESEIALIDQRKVEEKLNKLIDKELKIKKGSQNAIKIKIINHFVNLGYSKDLVTSILTGKDITSDKSKLKKDQEDDYEKHQKL